MALLLLGLCSTSFTIFSLVRRLEAALFTKVCLIMTLLRSAICDRSLDFKVTDNNCHEAKGSVIISYTKQKKKGR